MPEITEIVSTLSNLPRRQYAEVIREIDGERRRSAEREAQRQRPESGMSRDDFADWIAHQHFAIDTGIVRILYLPTNSPDNEVRLLEVNDLASLPDDGPVYAIDFLPDIEGIHFALFVADVTPLQHQSIMAGQLALPIGWDLQGFREIVGSE